MNGQNLRELSGLPGLVPTRDISSKRCFITHQDDNAS